MSLISVNKQQVNEMAIKAFDYANQHNTPLSEGIAKIAADKSLNDEQTKRVLEEVNAIALHNATALARREGRDTRVNIKLANFPDVKDKMSKSQPSTQLVRDPSGDTTQKTATWGSQYFTLPPRQRPVVEKVARRLDLDSEIKALQEKAFPPSPKTIYPDEFIQLAKNNNRPAIVEAIKTASLNLIYNYQDAIRRELRDAINQETFDLDLEQLQVEKMASTVAIDLVRHLKADTSDVMWWAEQQGIENADILSIMKTAADNALAGRQQGMDRNVHLIPHPLREMVGGYTMAKVAKASGGSDVVRNLQTVNELLAQWSKQHIETMGVPA